MDWNGLSSGVAPGIAISTSASITAARYARRYGHREAGIAGVGWAVNVAIGPTSRRDRRRLDRFFLDRLARGEEQIRGRSDVSDDDRPCEPDEAEPDEEQIPEDEGRRGPDRGGDNQRGHLLADSHPRTEDRIQEHRDRGEGQDLQRGAAQVRELRPQVEQDAEERVGEEPEGNDAGDQEG